MANYSQQALLLGPPRWAQLACAVNGDFIAGGSIRKHSKIWRNEAAEEVRLDGSNDSLAQISPGDLQEEVEAVGVGVGGQRYWIQRPCDGIQYIH